MFIAIVLMGGLGLIVGVILAIASKVFYVYVDPVILDVEAQLPGANCGGCGMPGCSANAEAIVAGQAAPNSCVAAGPEVALAIAAIMGVSVEVKEPDIALPGCTYGVADADTKYNYDGLNDCRAAALLNGGMKVCTIGCLGLGTCAQVCPFNAITMGPKGLPVVHEGRCTGCGTCERACPKHIITLSSVTRRILKEYTLEECTTPCQRACPAGINISGYIGAMAQGDHLKAVQVIKERNPFPTVIGRICPRPCENECRRQYVDEPVAINFLKRYAADYEKAQGKHVQPFKAPSTGRKVAVIGGGDRMGGLLRSAIARYRLSMDILDWDIEGIMEMGVKTETGKILGRDITIEDLLAEGNYAVFLAVGGWDSRMARTGGGGEHSPVPGCHLLIDVMKAGRQGYPQVDLDGHVMVVGNPNLSTAMIQRIKELGAEKITVLMREAAPVDLGDCEILIEHGISRLFGQGGRLSAIELIHTESRKAATVDTNHIVFAAGRMPEMIFIPTPAAADAENKPSQGAIALEWEALSPYKQPAYHQETGLLAKGDVLTDFSAAIKAIAAGRRAAASIHRSIYGIGLDLPDNVVTPETPIQNVDRVSRVPMRPRQIMPLAGEGQVILGMELEQGFDANEAQSEADRCLQCGLICYRRESAAEEKQAVAAGR